MTNYFPLASNLHLFNLPVNTIYAPDTVREDFARQQANLMLILPYSNIHMETTHGKRNKPVREN